MAESRIRRGIFRVLSGVLVAVAGVYGAEVLFRGTLVTPTVPETREQLERMVSPGWPRPVSDAKPEGTLRILGLADSFGIAGGAGNYHFVLEEELRARGLPVEMVNLSVPAYSPAEELLLLQRFGEEFEADVVLHGFFVGNDFGVPREEQVRFRGIDLDVVPGVGGWLPGNLMLVRWFDRWWEGIRDRGAREAEREQGIDPGSFSRERFLRIERVRFGTCRRPTGNTPAWPVTTALLDALATQSRHLGARHVLVVHPDQFQVEPALAREIVESFDLRAADYEIDLPQDYLDAWGRSRGVTVIDLTQAFREAGEESGLYLPQDTHYNDEGNRLAARVLADRLEPMLRALHGSTAVAAAPHQEGPSPASR